MAFSEKMIRKVSKYLVRKHRAHLDMVIVEDFMTELKRSINMYVIDNNTEADRVFETDLLKENLNFGEPIDHAKKIGLVKHWLQAGNLHKDEVKVMKRWLKLQGREESADERGRKAWEELTDSEKEAASKAFPVR